MEAWAFWEKKNTKNKKKQKTQKQNKQQTHKKTKMACEWTAFWSNQIPTAHGGLPLSSPWLGLPR